MVELCHNPLKSDCESSDIVVYIQVGADRLPICRQCWSELAVSDVEWGEEGLKVAEEITTFSQADQVGVNLEDEKKITASANTLSGQSEDKDECDAGRKFLEELAKTMKSA